MQFEQTYIIAPPAMFHSTSTLQPSGSTYASNPMLNAEGSATYQGYTEQTPPPGRQPRRFTPPVPEGDPTPIGDALLPLLLMTILYAFFNRIRKRKVS